MGIELGQLVMTQGIDARIRDRDDTDFADHVARCVGRHRMEDWGDVCDMDKETNNLALSTDQPGRLMSVYEHPEHPKIWIITEWDRSVTTVLFPDEY